MRELPADPVRVVIEVDTVDRWIGRETGAFQHQQVEHLSQPAPLRRPRGTTAGDAAVHKHETLHAVILTV